MIFFTSDLHFGHDREFLWGPRGFNSSQEHDNTIISNWNSIVASDDIVYILGDLMLRDNDYGMSCLKQLNGIKAVIIGNHDTDNRIALYKNSNLFFLVQFADRMKLNGMHFYLSHYPTNTSNLEKELWTTVINLHGHTHSKQKFFQDIPYIYNVALDAHDNCPVSLEEVICDVREEYRKCKSML